MSTTEIQRKGFFTFPVSLRLTLIVLLLAAILLRVLLAYGSLTNVPVNGDEAVSFLMANHISKGNYPLLFWNQPYQFPFESYFLSLFVDFLPWDPVGVRSVQIVITLSAVVAFAFVYRFLGSWKTCWPGLLLMLFPSAYWLARQVALMTPQHSVMAVFAAVLLLSVGIRKQSKTPLLWCAVGGLTAGMALSNHLLSLSIVVVASTSLCLAHDFKSAIKSTSTFAVGFLIGFTPYLYAKFFIPGAYQAVSETFPISTALIRLWNPIISSQVPTALGIDAFLLPDGHAKMTHFQFLITPVAIFFLALLLFVTVIRAQRFFRRLISDCWPTLELNDVFLGTTWIALILFSITTMGPKTRYALHVVWCFPFILSYAYAVLPKYGRTAISTITLALVAVNICNSAILVATWKKPAFPKNHFHLPRLDSLYTHFDKQGITRCYAGWWDSYRIILETKERIICSAPYNDRFSGWPQSFYREIVDKSNNTPFVAGLYVDKHLRHHRLALKLSRNEIQWRNTQFVKFRVYSGFEHMDAGISRVLPHHALQVRTSHSAGQMNALIDNDLESGWSSSQKQEGEMWIEIGLKSSTPVHALRLFSEDTDHERRRATMRIEARDAAGNWYQVRGGSRGLILPLKLDKKLPRYHFQGLELLFGFKQVTTDGLRVVIEQPDELRDWRLAEIHVFADAGHPNLK